ncbi:MAG: LamB/YcsF family protein, partial [Verrucomicrobia bacterium]|nr:LamB/YcsF family protein [Verrucomicrobiota bacterium]
MDLNCDLGEGEPAARTRALMRWITSANIACGGHAGDARTMEFCVRAAAAHG